MLCDVHSSAGRSIFVPSQARWRSWTHAVFHARSSLEAGRVGLLLVALVWQCGSVAVGVPTGGCACHTVGVDATATTFMASRPLFLDGSSIEAFGGRSTLHCGPIRAQKPSKHGVFPCISSAMTCGRDRVSRCGRLGVVLWLELVQPWL